MENNRDSSTKSPWQKELVNIPGQQENQNDSPYDVMIIGAGITGITTALLLQQQGKRCIILEGHNIGYGTTGGTTAHINTFFDSTYPEIESDFSQEAAKLVADAGKQALEKIRSLVHTHQIECDLESKTGYLFSETDKETKQLEDILESSQRAGVAVSEADQNGLPIPFQKSIAFEGQAQFHPLKYIKALAEEFIRLSGVILENTFISEVKCEDHIHIAYSDEREFKADHLVWATHVPPGINQFSFRCAPYRSYVLGIRLSEGSQYPTDMAYDMQEPYHYFRTHQVEGENILILGGADHKTGHSDPQQAFTELEDYASKYFDIQDIPYRWSSQYYVPVDGLPYIGPMNSIEENLYVATGFNGNGMTWATIAGQVISDAILKKENLYAELLKPSRMKPVAGFTEFVKENADVAYHFITDRFRSEDIDSLGRLNRGEGKVIDYKGEKMAVYKDDKGLITALHPTCTHAGCTVLFNAAEKSWDCPCHGGRFDIDGKVISGPPRKDLPPIEFSELGK